MDFIILNRHEYLSNFISQNTINSKNYNFITKSTIKLLDLYDMMIPNHEVLHGNIKTVHENKKNKGGVYLTKARELGGRRGEGEEKGGGRGDNGGWTAARREGLHWLGRRGGEER